MVQSLRGLVAYAVLTSWITGCSSKATHQCKASPGSAQWPSPAQWNALNSSISGRLLKPLPPTSVCHTNQPNYNAEICKQTDWTNSSTFADSPLGIINPNWSNDSCLPQPQYPCSGEGFPIYIVNATSAEHVSQAINFARRHNVRLNVKNSGHDYLGRSNAPNSLSIWTKNIHGFEFDNNFKPQGCKQCNSVPAVTLGAGENWGSIYPSTDAHNLTVVGGTGDTIGLGGYLTGGGHSPLSAKYGLAVDQVLEMEVVLPSSKTVIANQAQNADVFWAMRGGGGATFGIMTTVTLKTYLTMPMATISIIVITKPNSDAFWTTIPEVVSQLPALVDKGVAGYTYFSPSYAFSGSDIGGFIGKLHLPNGTIAEIESATESIRKQLSGPEGINVTVTTAQFPTLFSWYTANKNTIPIGNNNKIGNRLLDRKALSNVSALAETMRKTTPPGTLSNLNLVSGPGLWAATTASAVSVTPAWRTAYVEYVISTSWPFLNNTAERIQTELLTQSYLKALDELSPGAGSYLNEGNPSEAHAHQIYWGTNYPRLLSIKRAVDPTDVFWCSACVGHERWRERDNELCRI